MFEHPLYLLSCRVVERDVGCVSVEERNHLLGEMASVAVLNDKLPVLFLPFMSVWRHLASVEEKSFEVRHLVEQDEQEEVGRQVAIHAYLMKGVTLLRHTIVAQLGRSRCTDAEMDSVGHDKRVYRVDGSRWQIV